MTQYMLSVHGADDQEMPEDFDIQAVYAAVDAVNDEIKAAGAWVFGGGLHPAGTATVVASNDGEIVMTDGPYVDAKEHIGGFWIIQVADLDAALAWAAKATVACQGPIEVRPFQDDPGQEQADG
jgi:hypothetical protein